MLRIFWVIFIPVAFVRPCYCQPILPFDAFVLRVGDGTTALSGSAFQGKVFQFNRSGQVVDNGGGTSTYNPSSSSPLVTFSDGSSGIVFSGAVGIGDGALQFSADTSTLMVGGYANTIGSTAVVSSSTNRTIARVLSNGTTSYQVITGGPFGTGNFRSVTSINGTQTWMGGNNTGIITASDTATSNAQLVTVSSTVLPTRDVHIFGTSNSLFFSNGTAANGGIYVISAGNPAPITSGNAATRFISTSSATTAGFWMTNRGGQNYLGTGLDTTYFVDGSNVTKFEFNGTSWINRGSFTLTNPGGGATGSPVGSFITGYKNGNQAELFITFETNVSSNNYFVKLTDTSAFGNNISATGYDWSVAAGANFTFRGVAFSIPEPGTWVIFGSFILLVAVCISRKCSSSCLTEQAASPRSQGNYFDFADLPEARHEGHGELVDPG